MRALLKTFIRSRALAGNRLFGAISAGLVMLQVMRRLTGNHPKVLHSQKLRDDEVLVITNARPKR